MNDKLRQPPKTSRLLVRLAVVSVALLVILWLTSRSDPALHFYSENIFPNIAFGLTRLSNLVPFSLAELLLASLLLAFLYRLYRGLRATTKGWAFLLREIRGSFSLLALTLLVMLVSGYLFWGLNYARGDLARRLDWEDTSPQARAFELVDELETYCRQAVELTNQNYLKALGTIDIGSASAPSATPYRLDSSLDSGLDYANQSFSLGLQPDTLASRSKAFLNSHLLSWLGISGFYFPWTGEANVNSLVPISSRIHVVAHEKAHQRGVTSEDEANFIGFLGAICSTDPYVRYSGYSFAQVQLLSELYRKKPEAAARLLKSRLPGVQRDRDAVRDFWQKFEGPAMQVSSSVNDSYLKLHGVEGGIESYNRSSLLLLLFARDNDGSLAASPVAP